jgi:hypothetical protein
MPPNSKSSSFQISPEVHEWSLERLAALRADRTTVGLKLADVEVINQTSSDMNTQFQPLSLSFNA